MHPSFCLDFENGQGLEHTWRETSLAFFCSTGDSCHPRVTNTMDFIRRHTTDRETPAGEDEESGRKSPGSQLGTLL